MKPGFITAAVTSMLLLAGCDFADKARLRAEVRKLLKDPDSGKFSSEYIYHHANGETVLCGNFNAKNSFGAMAGSRRFLVIESRDGSRKVMIEPDHEEAGYWDFRQADLDLCTDGEPTGYKFQP